MDAIPRKLAYKYIIILAMLFVTADLSAVAVAYDIVKTGYGFASGATFIFPLTYALGDIVAEVYGYAMARRLIWFSLACQVIFAILVTIVINLPHPQFWQHQDSFTNVFGSTLRFVIAGTLANIASNFVNIYTISKWKIPLKGKYFWVRSILSTLISSLVLIAIAASISFSSTFNNTEKLIQFMFTCYILEIIYAFVVAGPAAITSIFLKQSENIDVYDYDTSFNPFSLK